MNKNMMEYRYRIVHSFYYFSNAIMDEYYNCCMHNMVNDLSVEEIEGIMNTKWKGFVNYRCDEHDMSPLLAAVFSGRVDMVELFLRYGAELERAILQEAAGSIPYSGDRSAIAKIITLLASKGADVNEEDAFEQVPLSACITREAADALINAGADVNKANENYGCTPLHYAIMRKKKDVVKALIERGADLYIPDKKGETAFDMLLRKAFDKKGNPKDDEDSDEEDEE